MDVHRERAARYDIGYVLKLYNYKWCRDSYTYQWKSEFQYLEFRNFKP